MTTGELVSIVAVLLEAGSSKYIPLKRYASVEAPQTYEYAYTHYRHTYTRIRTHMSCLHLPGSGEPKQDTRRGRSVPESNKKKTVLR